MSIASTLARTRTGWLAHLGLALSLLAMLGSSMHVLLVEHELCDAHGALVEADAAHAAGPSTGDDAGETAGEDADGTAPDTHDTDVHCPLGVASHAPPPVPPSMALELLAVDAPQAEMRALAALVITRDLWRVAPKTSPPAA